MPKTKSACSQRTFPPVSRRIMANRRLGCLTLFLFLALCASVIINVFLAIAVLGRVGTGVVREEPDRKSTRLNSSHVRISYAVFCLKKKKKKKKKKNKKKQKYIEAR